MTLKTNLYSHQIKAVEKLRKIKIGALYMEMGTGKTRTALELIKLRFDAGKVNKVLWLCPCNVKRGLAEELRKHADDISDIEICGIETLSSSVREILRLLDFVQKNSVYLIVDESNLVKNHRAIRTENIIRLAEDCQYKLILNGTPISRCEKDLFAQWYVLDWRILGYQSFWSFAANHIEYDEHVKGKIRRTLNVDYLVEKIAPYTYQVKKSECLDLPDKTYSTSYFELTRKQSSHYDYIAGVMLEQFNELKPHTIYRMFAAMQNITSGYRVEDDGKHIKRSPFFKDPRNNPRIDELLDNIVPSAKTIIYCKYTSEIQDIIKILNEDYGAGSAVAFYGDLTQKERQKSLEAFQGSANFLVANKTCAGYGLNLQFCSYIIYYNNDWDYATRAQSEDRVHRIGQQKNVHIVDICASGTLDIRIYNCLLRKENLIDNFKSQIKKKLIKEFIYGKDVQDGEDI